MSDVARALGLSAVVNGRLAAPVLAVSMLPSNDRGAIRERTKRGCCTAVDPRRIVVMSEAAIARLATALLG